MSTSDDKEISQSAVMSESISSLYERLTVDRQPFLDRARENAKMTIPALMPPQGHTGASKLYIPWQSLGAHGVNTLAAKLLKTVMPPNTPMFRLSVTDKVVEELDNINARAGVEKKLNEIERAVQDEIEGLVMRAAIEETMKQLIVSGNAVLLLPKSGNLKLHKLDSYVVMRDAEGNFLKLIIKETVAVETLPENVQQIVNLVDGLAEDNDEDEERNVDVYTCYYREDDRIQSFQAVKGKIIPGSEGSWLMDRAPVMVLRWTYLSDEDYGRSYVDAYIGDLMGAEALTKSLREAAAVASKVNPMVNPVGLTRIQDVAKAPNLQVIPGRKDDVSMLQFEKQSDMAFVAQTLDTIARRLQQAFMMNVAAQRDGERVTAEEIRSIISDIEEVLGGIYSLLAQDLQLPLVRRVMDRMVREKKIPDIDKLTDQEGKKVVSPKVITGVEALGRGQDYNRYVTFVRDVLAPLGDLGLQELNVSDFLRRAAVSLNIDVDGLLKSPEDKAAAQQQQMDLQAHAQNQQMMGDLVKGATPQISKVMAEQMAQQAQGEPQ